MFGQIALVRLATHIYCAPEYPYYLGLRTSLKPVIPAESNTAHR